MRSITYLLLAALALGCHSLLAQQKQAPLFTFGVMADVQYAEQDNAGTRHYRSSPRKLREAVKVFNSQKGDFVLHLGDFIDKGFRHFDTLNAITGQLRMPLYHILGNHDFSVEPAEKPKVLSKLGLEKPYYSFSKSNWRFIVLNGNDISLFANPAGSGKYQQAEGFLKKLKKEGAVNAYDWNGAVGKQQLDWLKKELATAREKGEQVIIACHYPLYPDDAAELLWNAPELRKLVEASPQVMAWFNGHVHLSQHFRENGLNYVSFRGVVEKEENAFAIVSVFRDRLEITGYGEEKSRVLRR